MTRYLLLFLITSCNSHAINNKIHNQDYISNINSKCEKLLQQCATNNCKVLTVSDCKIEKDYLSVVNSSDASMCKNKVVNNQVYISCID